MITLDMLKSAEYAKLADLPFEKRHSEQNRKRWGAWRWLGIMDNKDAILRIILQPGRRILDIGGAEGPFGFGSAVVDAIPTDIWHRPVPYKDIAERPYMVDVIFSSHMLEHVEDPWMEVEAWQDKLVIGGYLILHVPGIMGYQYWHPRYKSSHKWLFIDKADWPDKAIQDMRIVPLMHPTKTKGGVLSELGVFEIENVRDNSILVLARKQ